MYNSHFDFSERPFSITPNPRFLYSSARHVEAMAHLLHGLRDGSGFVQLTGEVGTGKTTVCRAVLEQLPEDVDVALILNPALNALELLRTICEELRLEIPLGPVSLKQLVDLLNAHLLHANAAGRQTVIILDEAQNLTPEVLEQIRLLTNLETDTNKLLQIFLIGQPELRQILGRPGLRQLAQRVTARYHLTPLNLKETHGYVRHRLLIAGGDMDLFPPKAIRRVFHHAAGIPRLINIICDRALLGAYTRRSYKVGQHFVDAAATEVAGLQRRRYVPHISNLNTAIVIVILALLSSIAYTVWKNDGPSAQDHAGTTGSGLVLRPATPEVVAQETPPDELRPVSAMVSESATGETMRAAPPATDREAANAGAAAITAKTTAQETKRDHAPAPPAATPESVSAPAPTPTATPAQTATPANLPEQGLELPSDEVSTGSRPLAPDARLLAYWGVESDASSTDICEVARRNGLQCFRDKALWSTLRELRWPVLLLSPGAASETQAVLLMGIAGEAISLYERGGVRVLSKEEFQRLAPEQYLALWRRPANAAARTLREGMRGADVVWLRKSIGKIHKVELAAEQPNLFDTELTAQIKIFQFTQGLAVDGVVGPVTVMQLTMAMHQPPSAGE